MQNKIKQSITMELAAEDDAIAIIELLISQHGRLYPKKEFYSKKYLKNAISLGNIKFIIAKDHGMAIGMICAQSDKPFGNLIFSLFTVHPNYRGLGIGGKMQRKFDKIISLENYDSAYVHCLTLDTHSQLVQQSHGYSPTGLLLGRYILDSDAGFLASDLTLPERRNHLIMMKALKKHDAGDLYLPEEYAEDVMEVFNEMKVSFKRLKCNTLANSRAMIKTCYLPHHNYCEMTIISGGKDIKEQIETIAAESMAKSTNIFINLKDSYVQESFSVLSKLGFFYTGVQPFLNGTSYMIMHKQNKAINFKEIATIEAFSARRAVIENSMKKTLGGKTVV